MNSLLHQRRPDLAVMLVIAAVFLLFFSPVLFTGKIFVTNDSFVYSYPLRSIAWDQIRHGSLPLWTPLLMSGYPLLSMAQLGLGYPLTWGYLFLPGYIAEEIYVLAPFLLSPIFMYAWVRVLGRSRLAALFAGLAFGYGGMMFSPIAHNGMLTNTFMWTPLILIAIERARTTSLVPCLFWASLAYAMSALTGIGQGIVQVTIVIWCYGAFLSLAAAPLQRGKLRWTAWSRWRPLSVAVGATTIGLGLSAFQIFETMQAQRLSIRSRLAYEIFSEGSFQPLIAVKSFLAPLYYQTDVTAYVVPLALLLAAWALVTNVIGPQRDLRPWFWFCIALLGWIWMLGPATPFYQFLYRIPVLNKFRVPSRHTFEWTFAIAIMAAYGWDAVAGRVATTSSRFDRLRFLAGSVLLITALMVAWLWWKNTLRVVVPVDSDPQILKQFLEWKLLFTVQLLIAAWLGWRTSSRSIRNSLLVVTMIIACLVEPATAASYWWWPKAKDPARFKAEATTTRFLKDNNNLQDRAYTHTSIWAEEYSLDPRIDPPNISALHGLRDVGGYEPLFLDRYSRALGNVTNDGVYPRPGDSFDDTIFSANSHVLDLLSTRFAIGYANLSTIPNNLLEKQSIKFFPYDSYFTIKPGERKTLNAGDTNCDGLALVTALGHAAAEFKGTVVARLHFRTSDGQTIEREFRAGMDSAEWSIDNPEIADTVKHPKASIFDSHPAAEGKFDAYRFWSLSPMGQPLRLREVEIENVSNIVEVLVWKASLYDSSSGKSIPLPHYDEKKWRPVYDENNLLILENQRKMPRAWLVGETRAVTGDEALQSIRGEGEPSFDPQKTALLENWPTQLPGGRISATTHAEVVSERPGRITVDTSTNSPAMLIVSEVSYPGWEATVNSVRVPIYTADYLLQAVEVPPGTHRVVLQYKATSARNGAIVSLIALFLLVALGIISRRSRRSGPATTS